MFKTPKFWYEDTTKKPSFFLRGLAFIYDLISKIFRKLQTPRKISKPVICIGNITMGGSGKTPVAIAVAKIIYDLGYLPHFLTRGYGANVAGTKLVDIKKHNYLDVGDEPLILASHGFTWVSKNRFKGASKAVKSGAGSIVMDDGLQNMKIYKDISILVIDATIGLGNNHIFPAGPLREHLKDTLLKINACIILNAGHKKQKKWLDILQKYGFKNKVFFADILLNEDIAKIKNTVAFAGIGVPKKFKLSLENAGVKVAKFYEFADHHKYTENELKKMLEIANKNNLPLVTTKKDFLRIPKSLQDKVEIVDIKLKWQNKEEILNFLKESLQKC